jgi:type IV secretory pathway VirB6-like protein
MAQVYFVGAGPGAADLITVRGKTLLENAHPDYMRDGVGGGAERFINEAFGNNGFYSVKLSTPYTLVGIGAPVKIFIRDIAEMLGAKAFVPPNYEVANAVGAVASNISAAYTVEIAPNISPAGITGYTVYGTGGNIIVEDLTEAVKLAEEIARKAAADEAVRRGVRDITISCSSLRNEAEAKDETIDLGTSVTARAIGSAGFEG